LGIFDQALYLLSRGEPPISSFTEFHILGDHAALILYPLSILYRIYPDVHWLLLVQAIALAVTAFPVWRLAHQYQLAASQVRLVVGIYLLYPLVLNINLVDFHPEVIALPAILWAIQIALDQKFLTKIWHQIGWFSWAISIALSCKAAICLSVFGMGIWLVIFERKRVCGAIAITSAIAWFLIATQVLIPAIGGESASITRHLYRYSYLGNSFTEIIKNLFWQPQLALRQIFSTGTLTYLALLFSPIIYCFGVFNRETRQFQFQQFIPLVGAIPALVMNILSEDGAQRNLIHQYSLPILPFLMLVVIASFQTKRIWFKRDRYVLAWAILAFALLSRLHFFAGEYWNSFSTWQATREAISLVQPQGSLLTTAEIAPHLTHRALVKLAIKEPPPDNLERFEYVLLNGQYPGWLSDREFANGLVNQLRTSSKFSLSYQRNQVYLFRLVK
jgi:uncharacterized membrane protein